MWVAFFLTNPWTALMGLVGQLSSTLCAIVMRLDFESIESGIYGFNGVLVGLGISTFHAKQWDAKLIPIIVIFGMLATVSE